MACPTSDGGLKPDWLKTNFLGREGGRERVETNKLVNQVI